MCPKIKNRKSLNNARFKNYSFIFGHISKINVCEGGHFCTVWVVRAIQIECVILHLFIKVVFLIDPPLYIDIFCDHSKNFQVRKKIQNVCRMIILYI